MNIFQSIFKSDLASQLLLHPEKVPSAKRGGDMSIGNALNFIKKGQTDQKLRDKLNDANGAMEIRQILNDEGLNFSEHDFDEAFHHMLTLCQSASQSDQIHDFKMWWTLIAHDPESMGCGKQCGNCG